MLVFRMAASMERFGGGCVEAEVKQHRWPHCMRAAASLMS